MKQRRGSVLIAIALTLLIGVGIAPTIPWQEFSSSMEALNVATAMEIRRTGNWLIPTLQGEQRIIKPPLTAWITAAAISGDTMKAVSSPNRDVRNAGFVKLAWQVRSVSLAFTLLTLLATFFIARALGHPTPSPCTRGEGQAANQRQASSKPDPLPEYRKREQTALASMVVFGTMLLLLRFTHYATLDIQLMLWVTLGNLFLIIAVVQRRWWVGCCGAGLALGLAMFTKGPVGLLESIVPIAIYGGWLGRRERLSIPVAPVVVGVLLFLVAGLWWYVGIALRVPDVWHHWWLELTGTDKLPENRHARWYTYLCLTPYSAPWIGYFIAGLIVAFQRRARHDVLLLLMLLVPIIVMSFFSDRYERYLLPMLPAAAVLTARVIGPGDQIARRIHWLTLGAIGVVFPIAASGPIRELVRADGQPWLPKNIAWSSAAAALVVIVICAWLSRRSRGALLLGTLIVMLGTQVLVMMGYTQTPQGLAEFRPLAEAIWQAAPDAQVYNAHPRGKRPPPEMGVYLNRVLEHIDDPTILGPGQHPKVLLVPQDNGEDDPTPPEGWTLLGRTITRGEGWWAFMLPARQ